MSTADLTALYEQFEHARVAAVASTDHYRDLSSDDPERPAAWDRAMEQTDVARQYLQAWLENEPGTAMEHEASEARR